MDGLKLVHYVSMDNEIKPKQNILETNIRRAIENFKTGEMLEVCGGRDMSFSEEDVKRIAEICSQKDKQFMFEDFIQGNKYTEENARNFIKFVKDGWVNKTHYVFFIRKSDGEIVGCMDIKGQGGEVGYWADENYSGFMTNAVSELSSIAKEAGFSKLFAWVRDWNVKSVGALERAGYEKAFEEEKEDKGLMLNYQKKLI